jgi:hypothetical protein
MYQSSPASLWDSTTMSVRILGSIRKNCANHLADMVLEDVTEMYVKDIGIFQIAYRAKLMFFFSVTPPRAMSSCLKFCSTATTFAWYYPLSARLSSRLTIV